MKPVSQFKQLPLQQVSDDLLWSINGRNNCFLRRSQGVSFSVDPTNLAGLNLKSSSGVTSQEGIGITINTASRRVKERKAKKKAAVVRFDLNLRSRRQLGKNRLTELKKNPVSNNAAFSSQRALTGRSCVKVLKRALKNYRPDLHSLALKRLRKLNSFKRANKAANRRDAKKQK